MGAPTTDVVTPEKHRASDNLRQPWQPGQSGNPAGRPKGARSKLGEAFIDALLKDWDANGVQAIIDMRDEKPGDYVKVIASILPKELDINGNLSIGEALDALPEAGE